MDKLALVGLGGLVGSVLRYLVGGIAQGAESAFPFGTLAVNFTGALGLGLIMFSSEYLGWFDEPARIFLAIGVMGAYTTVSTFGYESFRLLEQKEDALFLVNVAGTVILVLFAVYLAKAIVMKFAGA